jgi:hypothetical protein
MGTTYTPASILSGYASTDLLNAQLALISAELGNKVDRNGVAPNQMAADFDMNSHRILNLSQGVLGTDGVNLSQVQNIATSAVAAAGGAFSVNSSAPLTFNYGVATGSQGTVSNTTFNLTTLFGVTSFTGLTVIVNGVVQMPGLGYTVPSATTVVFSESLLSDSDIMFIYGDLSPTPVLPNILANIEGYDIAGYYNNLLTASDVFFKFVAVRSFNLLANFSGSLAHSDVAATASATFNVQKNGSNIGTLNFAAAATTATFTLASQTFFVAGDRLSIICPSVQDVSLSNVSITLRGYVT